MRRITILVGLLGAVLLGAVGAVPAIGSGSHTSPDVQQLFRQTITLLDKAGFVQVNATTGTVSRVG